MMTSQPDSEAKDLRIVLLGSRGAGKSWSGDTVLGGGGRRELGFGRTAQCAKRRGEVLGRRLAVVDTPGWWKSATVDETTELVKQELVCCASLCPPGPHAFLMVVRTDVSFLAEHKTSTREHVGLLGEGVWGHTLVLFTCGDKLGDKTLERYIETEGEALRWLIERCGNRYHVFNNKSRGDDGSQVTELLQKIEEMVAGHGGRHYEADAELLQQVEDMRTAERGRAEQRLVNVCTERQRLRSIMGNSSRLSQLRIVLLGHRTAGKSSSGNTILGKEEFRSGRTTQCGVKRRQTAGRGIAVVDTPGWWANASAEDTSELVKREIVSSVSLCPPGPHALLLVLRADVAFPNQFAGAILEHLSLIDERAWDHTVVLFTRGDYLGDEPIERHIESEGEALRWLMERCGNRYHVFNNKSRGDDGSQVAELLDKIEEMVAGNGGRHYEIGREISQTVNIKRGTWKQWETVMKKRNTTPPGPFTELIIVLLGHRGSGKSSSGNTILGREGLVSLGTAAGSVTRQGEVAGRLVTVVDTPGWCMSLSAAPVCEEEVRLEIANSASLRPHAFLLLVRVDVSFGESMKTAAEKHLLPLTEGDWSRVIVVFTHGDCLGDRAVERYVESEGEALRCLVEKCENRYHVFDNRSRGDGAQVTELLEKIEEMVAGNMSNASNLQHGSGDGLFFITPVSQSSDSEPRASRCRLPKLLCFRNSMDDSETLIHD